MDYWKVLHQSKKYDTYFATVLLYDTQTCVEFILQVNQGGQLNNKQDSLRCKFD